MLSSKRFLSAASPLPLLAACSFLLDFNGLQGGTKSSPDAGSGGTTPDAAAGSAGTSTAGAGGACSDADCDDQNPCTVDTCDASASDGCAHAYTEGLGLEQDFAPILADSEIRVTLTAGSDAFYFANYSVTGRKSEVEIFRLAQNGANYSSLKRLSTFAVLTGSPVSGAGLAVDTSTVVGESLHGLVAVKNAAGNVQVWQLATNAQGGFGVPTKVGDSYAQTLATNYPVARTLNGAVHGAWINADGTVSVLSPNSVAPAIFGVGAPPAGVLTLIGTDTNQPAVVFSGQTNGVFLETAGSNRVAMPECQTSEGGYASMSATALAGHNGIWFSSWTKYGTGFLTNEAHAVVCVNGACLPDTTTKCKLGDNDNLQRNPVTESVHLAGDPAEQAYIVSLIPVLSAASDAGTATASLLAFLTRLNSPLAKGATSTAIGSPLTLASQDALPTSLRGPDLPALAILPGPQVKVAVAWIQPPNSGVGSDELHLQRYRMCLPQ